MMICVDNKQMNGSTLSLLKQTLETNMSKKKRIPLKGGAEFDALTSARKYYIYLTNSGVAKSIKRGYNKRFRHHLKEELRRGHD